MVRLNKIYTKTGDQGKTALGNAERVFKYDLRVSTYGTVDETNTAIGLARLYADGGTDLALARIQNDMFDLGADICRPEALKNADVKFPPLRISDQQVIRIEVEIDVMNEKLLPLNSFVLPGGSPLAAHLHSCRTISRRAERLAVELSQKETLNHAVIKYLNRISDWFFVAARIANKNGTDDILWIPGKNR